MANPSRMKREIDKAKKERAAEKRERRQRSGAETDAETPEDGVAAAPQPASMPADEVLLQLEKLHARFDAHELDFESFERAKESLLAQLATE